MNRDPIQLFRIALLVVVLGLLLLGLTFLLPAILPLLGILLVLYVVYLFLTGRLRF